MTDHAELRRLAEEVIRIERNEDEPISAAWELFDSAANPKTVLAMLDEIDRLKAENETLREALFQISSASCSDARSVVIARTALTKGATK